MLFLLKAHEKAAKNTPFSTGKGVFSVKNMVMQHE